MGAVIGANVLRPDHILRRIQIQPAENRDGRRIADIHHDLRGFFNHVNRLVTRKIGAMTGTVFVGEHDERIESFIFHFLAEARRACLVLVLRDGGNGHRCSTPE